MKRSIITILFTIIAFAFPCFAQETIFIPHNGAAHEFQLGAAGDSSITITAPEWGEVTTAEVKPNGTSKLFSFTLRCKQTSAPRSGKLEFQLGISLYTFTIQQAGELKISKDETGISTNQFSQKEIVRAWFTPDAYRTLPDTVFRPTKEGVLFQDVPTEGWLWVMTRKGVYSVRN